MTAKKDELSTILIVGNLGAARKDGSSIQPIPETAGIPIAAKTVEGTLNKVFPFRAAIQPAENGGRALALTKAVMQAAGAQPGQPTTIEITRIDDESELRIPPDLAKALTDNPTATAGWKSITPNARRDWILSITTAKLPETRQRRIDKAIDMLSKGKRRLCCFPGLNWMTKGYPDAETWLPLPSAKAKI